MTLKECYDALGANYEETLGRLCSERLVEKFALKFPLDESFSMLERAIQEEKWEEAFRAAHTLKGVSLNLGFTKLYQASDELTEALRGGKRLTDDSLQERTEEEYRRTVALLREYENARQNMG